MWRSNPNWPSTFSACAATDCDGSARGGGLCGDCTEKRLAEIVGKAIAYNYREAIRTVRRLEKEMEESA
ncbi:MAG: hypothetical protein V4733_03620 [Verrucomicrobiota bacterium]